MINKVLSLSFLKSNWNDGKDYLDNFVPFVGEVTSNISSEFISLHEVQVGFSQYFGFEIPQGTIKNILNRLKSRGYLIKEQRAYKKTDKLDEFSIIQNRDELIRKYNKFIKEYIQYATEHLKLQIQFDKAEKILNSFIETNSKQIDAKFESVINGEECKQEVFALNKFIVYVCKNEPDLFDYLSCIVQGNMLAMALYVSGDANNIQTSKIQKLEIYFDTQFLLRLLGFEGKILQKPCVELIQLINKHNIRKYYFEHTFNEIQNIIDVSHRINRGEARMYTRADAIAGILSKYKTASEIALLNISIEQDLKKLGITKRESPDLTTPLSIDEIKLQETLNDIVKYRVSNGEAIHFDIDSLTSIWRLRKGRDKSTLETCDSLFVTTNYKL